MVSVSKIISESCELVKLCHINRSGPVVLRHNPIFVNLKKITKRTWTKGTIKMYDEMIKYKKVENERARHVYMQARPLPSCGVRLSVRPSVTFVDLVKTSNPQTFFYHRVAIAKPF